MKTAAFVAIVGLACGGPTALVHEMSGSASAARAPEAVDVYRNSPPTRPFVTRSIIDLVTPSDSENDALGRFRDIGASLGCDAVVVYTFDHPAAKTIPTAEELALVVGRDGVLSWRAIEITSPNRRTFYVEGPALQTVALGARPIALCVAYGG